MAMSSIEQQASANCFFLIIMFIINITLGAYCFGYDLEVIIGKDVAWGWDIVGGLILGGLAIVVAIVCFIVHEVADVDAPFIKTDSK